MDVSQNIAQTALRWFRASAECQKKHPIQLQWTVFAAFVLRVVSNSDEDTYDVVSIGTGTKCLGQRELNEHGLVINDGHAEIIARRALIRYLYQEVFHWNTGADISSSIFERDPHTLRLRLKPTHTLHLYISEAPCGDASIYPLRVDVVEVLARERQERDSTTSTSHNLNCNRSTGAKLRQKRTRDDGDNVVESIEKRFDQVIGIPRVKSGRSDLPTDKQTLSMSCSDKLTKWSVKGLQGTLLLKWYKPLFLSSIVISGDEAAASMATQQAALERALCGRLKCGSGKLQLTVLSVDDHQFDRRRITSKKVSPSPLSLNWTRAEAYWGRRISIPWPNQSAFFSSNVEIIVGTTGFKQGAKKSSKMDMRAMEKVASRLCKRQFYHAFQSLSQTHKCASIGLRPYYQAKQAVGWDFNDHVAVLDQLICSNWIGVPVQYKQFTLYKIVHLYFCLPFILIITIFIPSTIAKMFIPTTVVL